MRKFRLSRGPAIKKGKAKLRLQRVDRIADGGGSPPKTPCSSGEASLLDGTVSSTKSWSTGVPGGCISNFLKRIFSFIRIILRPEEPYLFRREGASPTAGGPTAGG